MFALSIQMKCPIGWNELIHKMCHLTVKFYLIAVHLDNDTRTELLQ
jgi:hypothetical protein